ncbi:hypothetical protein OVA14_07450 [Agrococcus sp. SL85]|uniref:hypothetical protein n=1 Tax=Agrococcus sp. SL85 TaxID=2995141 RepID=UPI00226CE869|nr:hypothetical protein [Agrococcus sp. SL85]WAC65226.1 hypothetical protein OVA14_07450 [Agrococcus sp. SL85]
MAAVERPDAGPSRALERSDLVEGEAIDDEAEATEADAATEVEVEAEAGEQRALEPGADSEGWRGPGRAP